MSVCLSLVWLVDTTDNLPNGLHQYMQIKHLVLIWAWVRNLISVSPYFWSPHKKCLAGAVWEPRLKKWMHLDNSYIQTYIMLIHTITTSCCKDTTSSPALKPSIKLSDYSCMVYLKHTSCWAKATSHNWQQQLIFICRLTNDHGYLWKGLNVVWGGSKQLVTNHVSKTSAKPW